MTVLAFAAGLATALLLIGAAYLTTRARVISSRIRDRVIVTCKSGDTFAGVLYSHDSKAIVLREAEALGAGENRANLPLDGELILLLPDVNFIQRP